MRAPVRPAAEDIVPAVPDPGFLRRTVSSLSWRNFRLFFVGQTISNTGNWLTMVALTLLVLHRTGSGIAIGALAACQFGPILVLSAWAGVVVDRARKYRMLFVTQSLEMLQSFALAALAFAGDAPLVAFYAIALAGGAVLAFDNPVRRTFVSEMVPAADLPNAVTLYTAMINIARIAGPALAAVLVLHFGYGWCFTIDGLSYFVVIGALALMRTSELHRTPVTPRGRGQVRAGLRYIRSVPELWITFVSLLIVGTISYNYTVVLPLFVEQGLHGSDADYALVYSAFSAGALVGAFTVARRATVTLRTVVVATVWLGAAMLALAAVPDITTAYLLAAVTGGASVAYMTATTALAQLRTDPQMVGRVLALQLVLIAGTTPIGAPLLGLISDAVGGRAPMFVGAIGAFAAAAFVMVAMRHDRRLDHDRLDHDPTAAWSPEGDPGWKP